MDWKEALEHLAVVAPKLAFKDELVQALRAHSKQNENAPPSLLLSQLEVVVSVAKQNLRVAQLHGYLGLEQHARTVEVAVQNVLSALRAAGVSLTSKNQQAQQI
jgi:hypothetical protein